MILGFGGKLCRSESLTKKKGLFKGEGFDKMWTLKHCENAVTDSFADALRGYIEAGRMQLHLQ